ncbi:TatD family hydrolase [Leucothrix arctica]|uniref:DNAase n=1 Tax=Leucothrix arctica TaxID=1481894 RepID=A0A317CJ57_9GAMM|nr:TatD family hydrolase [Leucothrix arctica]PWQ96362.1 DNAase [Leucothrix arctica]
MRLIDSHCHLDLVAFDSDREVVTQSAATVGVSDIIIPAVEAASWTALARLCQREQSVNLYAAYGLHPMFMDQHTKQHLLDLEQQLSSVQSIAVGECGLDFFIQEHDKSRQLDFFTAQLDLAVQFQLPVIIHSRKSLDYVLKELRIRPSLSGVVHSFSGSLQQAKQLLDLGFYLGFGGPVTYARATKLRALVQTLPLDGLLLETDAPDQPDATHYGLRNESAWIVDIAECFAELRKEPVEYIAEVTTSNAIKVFDLV